MQHKSSDKNAYESKIELLFTFDIFNCYWFFTLRMGQLDIKKNIFVSQLENNIPTGWIEND